MATLNVRLSDSDYNKIIKKAESYGLSISEYIRLVALNSNIKIEVNK